MTAAAVAAETRKKDRAEENFILSAKTVLRQLSRKVRLKHHQYVGLFDFILFHERRGRGGIICDEMGLGKTIQSIAALVCNPMGRTLILVPVSLLSQWEEALLLFNLTIITVHNPDSSFTQLGPSTGTKVFLATHSCLLKSDMHPFFRIPWDRVIVDEAHVLKNPRSLMHTNAMLLTAKIHWALTATPIQNEIDDIVSLARFVGAPNPENTTEVCQHYMLRRTMKELVQRCESFRIPDLTTRYLVVTLNENERALYDSISNKSVSTISRMLRQRMACVHPGMAVMSMHKRPKASGHGSAPSLEMISSKIVELRTDILQHTKTKSLIFCTWTKEISLIRSVLTKAGMRVLVFDGSLDATQRQTVLSNFKLPEFNVLILQIACGSVGLNLQQATQVYIMSPSWNPTTEMQAIARTHRQGQTQRVTCTRLVAKDTIEERCLVLQHSKRCMIDETTNDDMLGARMLLRKEDLMFLAGGQGVDGYRDQLEEAGFPPPPEKSMVPRKRKHMDVIKLGADSDDGVQEPGHAVTSGEEGGGGCGGGCGGGGGGSSSSGPMPIPSNTAREQGGKLGLGPGPGPVTTKRATRKSVQSTVAARPKAVARAKTAAEPGVRETRCKKNKLPTLLQQALDRVFSR